ncbi:MAG TPA: hydantoinase B/oxoprolinase family protein [Verrucomicrobiales bacterium]|nr:hydantoinase B/oxoprolinase family protein [Verrucomicrobiales bacterium]
MLDYSFRKQTPASLSYGSTKQHQKNEAPLKTDPVELELFTNRFGTVVEEMGNMLQRTAVSTNVKERQDYSCALLDASGELIVNAPHIPVHLGALGICVRRIMEEFPMNPGDTIVTNHPAYGGSHLPDVTVITPFFHQSDKPAGFLANRAHHAEIGGIQPGSMSPSATCLAEEGVVIPPTHLFRSGKAAYEILRDALLKSAYPTRNLSDNLADLRAQVAANLKGIRSMARLSEIFGGVTVDRYMAAIKEASASILSARIRKIPDGRYAARQKMDDGSKIEVSLDVYKDRIRIDFEGTSGEHPGNFNAGPAIVQSAVIYFLRLIVDQSMPLNEGFLRQISLKIPRGMLNPYFPEDPSKCPAVVGGNVETSQRIVDTLLLALEKAACSQGTMNNLVFGNSDISYYETLCGGAGAGEGFHGADAVHTHMTNTAITDPEILEHRYAVILNRFAIRRGSGGKGKFHGGDGILREITFLAPYSLSLLTQHRIEEPYGLNGGSPGKRGKQTFITKNGNQLILPSTVQMEIQTGDRLIMETPGGGGWGGFSTVGKQSGSSKAPEPSD